MQITQVQIDKIADMLRATGAPKAELSQRATIAVWVGIDLGDETRIQARVEPDGSVFRKRLDSGGNDIPEDWGVAAGKEASVK